MEYRKMENLGISTSLLGFGCMRFPTTEDGSIDEKEALAMIDMAGKQIIPAVVKYSRTLADTVIAVKEAGADASTQMDLLKRVSTRLTAMQSALTKLEEVEKEASAMTDVKAQAFFYKDTVKAVMEQLRTPADELEMIVDKEIWPIPTYGELMFEI